MITYAHTILLALAMTAYGAATAWEDLPAFDGLWNYDEPAATRSAFMAILPRAEMSADTLYLAELLTQIARTYSLERQFDSAHALLDRTEGLLPAAGPSARVRYLLERGRSFNSAGERDTAATLFQAAWEIAIAEGLDFHAVDAAHMMAIALPPDRQQEWNLKALDIAERSDDPRVAAWRGSLYNNMGWTLFDAGKFDSALAMFENALEFRQSQAKENEIWIARWCVARCLRALGRIEESLASQMTLLAERERVDAPDGYVHEEIAECLLLLNRNQEARPYFQRAWELLSQDAWLAQNEPQRLARLKSLGQ